ncbi:MAG: site-specific DNA-methyltransferase, partial [Phycisphaeraceae bacterium]
MAKKKSKKTPTKKTVQTLTHGEASRKNIPTAEFQSVVAKDDLAPKPVGYERPGGEAAEAMQDELQGRNPDLDPQLVWRGKDLQDWSDLVVQAPPLFIQEKVHPKVLVDDLRRQTEAAEIARKMADKAESGSFGTIDDQLDMFADFNGIPDHADAKTEFYAHDANWTNRMILGDSLQVMASLAEREGLRGQVQCIYLDPPYGIKFNSNFQWSTTSRDVKDGKADHITREPEQVKAFRDTWRDGIHSYLTYLRDRLTVARDLLHESGSIFVQIGDENVHRVRAVMDEVFGEENFCLLIFFKKTAGDTSTLMPAMGDYILWYSKNKTSAKYRPVYVEKQLGEGSGSFYTQLEAEDSSGTRPMTTDERQNPKLVPDGWEPFTSADLKRQGRSNTATFSYEYEGRKYHPGSNRQWKTNRAGLDRLNAAGWLYPVNANLRYKRFFKDFRVSMLGNMWTDTETGSFIQDKVYVVQTGTKVVERCLLMATDPGDLVLDPTCGSGTTAYVAEQWGRRWITIDTSRVSLALARARIMGARYPYYLLADSKAGQLKEAELTHTEPSTAPTHGNVRHGFVYERVPHITLKSIANNAEIDVIWERYQAKLEPLREQLNQALKKTWEEWEIPREAGDGWSDKAKAAHADWWKLRIQRQKEIDASIAAKADSEYLYDKPYEDKKTVRVAGPFTVESISPHRMLGVDENDEIIDPLDKLARSSGSGGYGAKDADAFMQMVIENLRTAGVQQAHKEDRIELTSITPWPGSYIAAEARYDESGTQRRAGIFIGPEFGTVSRQELVNAAREAGDADFDVVIACAFNYEAHTTEFSSLGRIKVLKARMNADLHMADDLKNTGKGNLFVIFGEPDIDILPPEDAPETASPADYDQ